MKGFLFRDVVTEPGRLGCSKWPLIGAYKCVGITVPEDAAWAPVRKPGDTPATLGIDYLTPSDQHVHLADGYGEQWHIGVVWTRVRLTVCMLASLMFDESNKTCMCFSEKRGAE
jgi:hypothetical protein